METKARAPAWNRQAAIEHPKPGPQVPFESLTSLAKVNEADEKDSIEMGAAPAIIVPMRVATKATIAKANRVVPQQGLPQLAKQHRSESIRMKLIIPKT